MEINGCLKVISIPEAASHLLDRLDLRVQPLAHGIRDPVSKIGQNIPQVFAEHPGYRDHWFQSRTNSPAVPRPKVTQGPAQTMIAPQLPQAFLDRARPRRPKLQLPQHKKQSALFTRDVLSRIQPQILRPRQRLLPFLLQQSVFLFPNLIHRLHHVRHQMVAVKNDLPFRLRNMLPDRGQIRVPNVGGDGLNSSPLSPRQTCKVPVQTFLSPVVPDIFHRRFSQVIDDRQIIMPLPQRFLIAPIC